jgi:Sap, sulfolipid-1-addressing protein
MSAESIVTLIVLASALALQPWSLLASGLLATSRNGIVKCAAYTLGWFLAVTAVMVITAAFHFGSNKSSTNKGVAILDIVLGGALTVFVWIRWQRSKRPTDKATKTPKWMEGLDRAPVWFAFGLGAFLPNYVVAVAAVGEIQDSTLGMSARIAVGLAFTVASTIGVAAPLIVIAVRHNDADEILQRARAWLMAHGTGLVTVVLLILGVALIVKGVVALL